MKYLKAAFVVYSISQTAVDFNGGDIDKIKQELNKTICVVSLRHNAYKKGCLTSRHIDFLKYFGGWIVYFDIFKLFELVIVGFAY